MACATRSSLPDCSLTVISYTVTVTPGAAARPRYVNMWFDWNRDGDWQDTLTCTSGLMASEWAVQDHVINVGPGTHVLQTPFVLPYNPNPDDPLWMRMTLAPQPAPTIPGAPIADGRGPANGYNTGETEDYYLWPEPDPDYDIYIKDNDTDDGSVPERPLLEQPRHLGAQQQRWRHRPPGSHPRRHQLCPGQGSQPDGDDGDQYQRRRLLGQRGPGSHLAGQLELRGHGQRRQPGRGRHNRRLDPLEHTLFDWALLPAGPRRLQPTIPSAPGRTRWPRWTRYRTTTTSPNAIPTSWTIPRSSTCGVYTTTVYTDVVYFDVVSTWNVTRSVDVEFDSSDFPIGSGVLIVEPGSLWGRWTSLTGFSPSGNTLLPTSFPATMVGVALGPYETARMTMTIAAEIDYDFTLEVTEYVSNTEVGGIEYVRDLPNCIYLPVILKNQ